MEGLIIRKLRVEDTKDIVRIQEQITQSKMNPDFNSMIEQEAGKPDSGSFVTELDGRVIGFMISYILTGSFGMEESAWIAVIGVESQYMGQGIGKRLAEEIFRFYKEKGIENIYTSVRWDSTDLLSFFKTLDFDRSNFINLKKVLV